jgi:hypothetical protein
MRKVYLVTFYFLRITPSQPAESLKNPSSFLLKNQLKFLHFIGIEGLPGLPQIVIVLHG